MKIADLLIGLLVDDKGFAADVEKKAGKAGEKAGTTMGGRIGGGLKKAFSGAGKHLTAIGSAAGFALAGAAESAVVLEDQLRTIQTVAPDLNLDKTREDLQALSRETGRTTDDLAAGFYDLVSAGVSADDAINVLRDSAKFATGALGTTGEAANLVVSAMNAYGMEAKDSARITDIFAKAVADGQVTASALGNSISQIAPIAAAAGVSLEEVSAGYALLTAKGVPAAQAATQMRAAISALLTPNAQLNKLQKETGINFAELAKEKGLAVALEEIRKATKGNADAFAKSLGSVEAYQFALATTGDNAEAMANQIVETADSAGLATDQYNIKSQSMAEQAKRLAAQIVTFGQDVGASVGPLGQLLFTVNQLGPGLRGIISPAKVLGSALGGLAGKIAPSFLKGLGGFGKKVTATIVAGFMEALIPTTIAGEALGEAAATGAGSPKVAKLFGVTGAKLGTALGVGILVAVPLALAGISKLVTDAINNDFQKAGVDVEFAPPGSGPFGIFGAIHNLQEALKGIGQVTGEGLKQGLRDPLNQTEQILRARGIEMGLTATRAVGTGLGKGVPSIIASGQAIVGSLDDAKTGLGQLGDKAETTAEKLKRGAKDSAGSWKTFAADILGLARTEINTAYQIIEDRAALAAANVETAELAKVIATGNATREQKDRYVELGQTQANLLIDLAENGVKSGKEVAKATAQMRERLKTATGQERKAILRTLEALRQVSAKARQVRDQINALVASGIGLFGNPDFRGRAAGGPVKAYEAYKVGERGEEIFVPTSDGRIIPNHDLDAVAATSQTGGGNTYNVNLLDKLEQRTASDIGSSLRILDRRGWLPGS